MMRMLLVALLLAPSALAHGETPGIDDQLVESGQELIVGEFTAPQPGALVVVPFVDGALGCSPPEEGEYAIALTNESGVSFAANATQITAWFDLPRRDEGYASFAVDTHDATRTLLLMEQAIVAEHALVGVVVAPGGITTRTGALGLPYAVPGTSAHDMGDFRPEGGGILLSHDDSFLGASTCAGDEAGHVAMSVLFEAVPDALAPGRLVHAVAMYDPGLSQFPPRPLDDSTGVLQANLYLARPAEDPERVRDALEPGVRASDVVPVALVVVGLGLSLGFRRTGRGP
jgi:hypothetical protein